MVAYEFGVIDYVIGTIHLALLVVLFFGGLYMFFRGTQNDKI